MKTKVILPTLFFVAAVLVLLFIYTSAQKRLRGMEQALVQQREQLAEARAENARLSNLVATAKRTQRLSPNELEELLGLRNEVGRLQETLSETNRLARENRQMREGLRVMEQKSEMSKEDAQQARLAMLEAWLESNPGEKIPELQFIPRERWLRGGDRSPVTEDDYRGMMGALRSGARARFARMAHSALEGYLKANNDTFPAEVSQLTPYFEKPIDPEILSGYTIVSAKTLIEPLREAGRDWVITHPLPNRFET